MRKLSALTAALAAILPLAFGNAPPTGPSAPTKRLRATNRTYDQWRHSMIVSASWEIQGWNRQVKRRNQRFARAKGIS